ANIGLKWNLKNGGTNHVVKDTIDIITSGKAMVVGYDVTHPTNMSNDKSAAPSLVGMVASVDKDLGQWPAIAWEQPSRQEMLGDEFTEKFRPRLLLWRQRNQNRLPEFIIIYRDGVSEGPFTQVLTTELPMIRKACDQLYLPKQHPRLSIIVSVKPRPAHYAVLLGEIFREKYGVGDLAADQLEKLTHNLCYLFGRATKTVSICPSADYADIVCERARVHRPALFDISDAASTTTSASQPVAPSNNVQVHPNLQDTMYYI
ncbi:ribonuclease H-like domain-containing protein, partial [Colletotrichum godetiae]